LFTLTTGSLLRVAEFYVGPRAPDAGRGRTAARARPSLGIGSRGTASSPDAFSCPARRGWCTGPSPPGSRAGGGGVQAVLAGSRCALRYAAEQAYDIPTLVVLSASCERPVSKSSSSFPSRSRRDPLCLHRALSFETVDSEYLAPSIRSELFGIVCYAKGAARRSVTCTG